MLEKNCAVLLLAFTVSYVLYKWVERRYQLYWHTWTVFSCNRVVMLFSIFCSLFQFHELFFNSMLFLKFIQFIVCDFWVCSFFYVQWNLIGKCESMFSLIGLKPSKWTKMPLFCKILFLKSFECRTH